jgi:predicted TIM-barrel fold metal-dependent hydrolase
MGDSGSGSAIGLVSADSHVVESPSLWADVVPESKWGDLTTAFAGKAGAYDADARIDEMGIDGVVAEVLYPSLAMKLFTLDPEPQVECFRRYNEWLASYCGLHPTRLYGVGLVSTYDIDHAVQEARQCADLGLRGVMIWQTPHPDLPFTGSHYEPFWAECAALGLPVSLHAITGFDHSQELFARMAASDLQYGVDFYRVVNFCVTTVVDSLLDIVFSGALDRHPGARLVLVENEVNWLPFILDQWDFFYGRFRSDELALHRKPSDVFREQVFATYLQDRNVAHTVAQLGAGNLMWSNDYPHDMSTWPHSQELIAERLADVSDDDRVALLGGTARALYDIDAV